jgi:PIN domain nuclease of toxin-antitoxin system
LNILLDTHVLYWVMAEPEKLTQTHRTLLETATARFVSSVSAWEIATKVRLGKWSGAAPLLPNLLAKVEATGFDQLQLSFAQAEKAGSFPFDHRDPFDRMLAAQALDLDLTLLTVDKVFTTFGCKVA